MFVDELTGGQAIHFSQSEESQCEKDGMQLQFSSKLALPHSFKVLQVKGQNAGDPELRKLWKFSQQSQHLDHLTTRLSGIGPLI